MLGESSRDHKCNAKLHHLNYLVNKYRKHYDPAFDPWAADEMVPDASPCGGGRVASAASSTTADGGVSDSDVSLGSTVETSAGETDFEDGSSEASEVTTVFNVESESQGHELVSSAERVGNLVFNHLPSVGTWCAPFHWPKLPMVMSSLLCEPSPPTAAAEPQLFHDKQDEQEVQMVRKECPTPSRPRSSAYTQALRRRHRTLARKCCRLRRVNACHAERARREHATAQQAIQEKEVIRAAYRSLLHDIEVTAKTIAREAKLPVPPETEEAKVEHLHWASQLAGARARVMLIGSAIQVCVQRAAKAQEVLGKVLSCSLSLQVFRRPVLAPDGHVYERSWIARWLQHRACSPVTQEHMRRADLLRVRTVEHAAEALWLLRGAEPPVEDDEALDLPVLETSHFNQYSEAPSESEDVSITREAEDTGMEGQDIQLHDLIQGRDEVGALELLQRGQVDGINELYGEELASLLTLALLNGLPSIAVALARHPAFDRHDWPLVLGPRTMVVPLHIAASLGLVDLCEALLEHCGAGICMSQIDRDVTLHLNPGGLELSLPRGENAIEMARHRGHADIVSLMDAAVEAL